VNDHDHGRILAAVHQQHRIDRDKLALQAAVYRQQLVHAGLEPDDREDDDLIRLWRVAADTVSAASALVAELGTQVELLDPHLVTRTVSR
jgi:hypothetical protein